MPSPDVDYSLYLATDRALLDGRPLCAAVQEAVANGVTVVQLREKDCPGGVFFETARAVHAVTERLGVPLIINDRVDVMLAVGAEGVHIGRADLPLDRVRTLAPGAILGYSVNRPEHLAFAERVGADYVGVGPVYATATKRNTGPVLGLAGLREIVLGARVPCVGIGGITAANAADAIRAGAAGVCVISAIMGQADIGGAARGLAKAVGEAKADP